MLGVGRDEGKEGERVEELRENTLKVVENEFVCQGQKAPPRCSLRVLFWGCKAGREGASSHALGEGEGSTAELEKADKAGTRGTERVSPQRGQLGFWVEVLPLGRGHCRIEPWKWGWITSQTHDHVLVHGIPKTGNTGVRQLVLRLATVLH